MSDRDAELVRVGTVSLTYSARLTQLLKTLHGRVDAFSRQKAALDAEIQRRRNELSAVFAGRKQLDADGDKVYAELVAAKKTLARVATDTNALPAAVRDGLQRRAVLVQNADRLEDDTVAAQAAGQGTKVASLAKQTHAIEEQIAELDRELAGKLGAEGAVAQDLQRQLEAVKQRLFKLQLESADLSWREEAATAALVDAAKQRSDVDGQLVAAGRAFANADFSITRIYASVGGSTVFDAEVSSPASSLSKIDEQLADVEYARVRLRGLLQASSAQATLAAHQLATFQDHLMSGFFSYNNITAYSSQTIDTSFDVLDLILASRKGPVGILTELGKKLADKYVLTANPTVKYPPGSPEDDIDKEYSAGLKNTLSIDGYETALGVRWLKEFTTKPAKDALNWGIGRIVLAKYGEIPPAYKEQTVRLAAQPTQGKIDALKKWWAVGIRRDQLLVDDLRKWKVPLANNFPSLPAPKTETAKGITGTDSLVSLAESIAKDLAKNTAKGFVDKKKRDEFVAYAMQQGIYADAASILELTRQRISDADALTTALLAEKERRLDGFDPTPHIRIVADKPFDPALQVLVHVTMSRTGETQPITFDFALGGRSGRSDPFDSSISVAGVTQSAQGLGLQIQAH